MKTTIIYVAEDGKKFEDKIDCEKYERLITALKVGEKDITVYNDKGQIIPLNENYRYKIYYVKIDSENGAIAFKHYCDSLGMYSPFELYPVARDFFWYDTDDDDWKSLKKEVNLIKTFAKAFNINISLLLEE